MKNFLFILVILSIATFGDTGEIADPVQYLTDRKDLPREEIVRLKAVGFKQIIADINGDSINDMLLCFDDPDSDDPVESASRSNESSAFFWDVFIRISSDGKYRPNGGPMIDGVLGIGAPILIDVNFLYVGQISEINRHGIVTLLIENNESGDSTSVIRAYFWDVDRVSSVVLDSYSTGDSNNFFDRYVSTEKRTLLEVRQIKP